MTVAKPTNQPKTALLWDILLHIFKNSIHSQFTKVACSNKLAIKFMSVSKTYHIYQILSAISLHHFVQFEYSDNEKCLNEWFNSFVNSSWDFKNWKSHTYFEKKNTCNILWRKLKKSYFFPWLMTQFNKDAIWKHKIKRRNEWSWKHDHSEWEKITSIPLKIKISGIFCWWWADFHQSLNP